MPVYEYYCVSCDLEYELIRPVPKRGLEQKIKQANPIPDLSYCRKSSSRLMKMLIG